MTPSNSCNYLQEDHAEQKCYYPLNIAEKKRNRGEIKEEIGKSAEVGEGGAAKAYKNT